MQDNKVSKLIDGEKLHRDMQARYESLQNMIQRDFAGNPEQLYNKWMEVKYWKEAISRHVYDIKGGD